MSQCGGPFNNYGERFIDHLNRMNNATNNYNFNDLLHRINNIHSAYMNTCCGDCPDYQPVPDVPREIELKTCSKCGIKYQPYMHFRIESHMYCQDCLDELIKGEKK